MISICPASKITCQGNRHCCTCIYYAVFFKIIFKLSNLFYNHDKYQKEIESAFCKIYFWKNKYDKNIKISCDDVWNQKYTD